MDWTPTPERQLELIQASWRGERPTDAKEREWLEWHELSEKVRANREHQAENTANKWLAFEREPGENPPTPNPIVPLATKPIVARSGVPPTDKQIRFANALVYRLSGKDRREWRDKVSNCRDRREMSEIIDSLVVLTKAQS